jgi:TPR repeat protein
MKFLIMIFLIFSLNLEAKTTNLYNHAKETRAIERMLFYANRGNIQAQFDLAMAYAKGEGVKRDESKAFYWFHKSARGGHTLAKYYMGISFLEGRGVRRDIHLARYWFKQAINDGHKKSVFYLAIVEKSLHKRNRYIKTDYLSRR